MYALNRKTIDNLIITQEKTKFFDDLVRRLEASGEDSSRMAFFILVIQFNEMVLKKTIEIIGALSDEEKKNINFCRKPRPKIDELTLGELIQELQNYHMSDDGTYEKLKSKLATLNSHRKKVIHKFYDSNGSLSAYKAELSAGIRCAGEVKILMLAFFSWLATLLNKFEEKKISKG